MNGQKKYSQLHNEKVFWTRELVGLLIMKYRENENLYNTSHPQYTDREQRAESLLEIVNHLKVKNEHISEEFIKRKIHTLRSQFIKELREIATTKKNVGSKVHEPKLWCFDELQFLIPFCNMRSLRPNVSQIDTPDTLEDESILIPNRSPSIKYQLTPSPSGNEKNSNKRSRYRSSSGQADDNSTYGEAHDVLDMETTSHLQNELDGLDHLGLAWAAKLRQMVPAQSKIAQRLISEVLFQGDWEMLTLQTGVERKKKKIAKVKRSFERSSSSSDRHVSKKKR